MVVEVLSRKLLRMAFVVLLILLAGAYYTSIMSTHMDENILDGCYHVYLDVGSNIGVQVRKLYQPEHFPNATIINQFRLAFGG